MPGDNKDDQFFFQFTSVDGPEKPALEPEDDSLLDLDANDSSPENQEIEEEESWTPPPVVHVEEERQMSEAAEEIKATQTAPVAEPAVQEQPKQEPPAVPGKMDPVQTVPTASETAPIVAEAVEKIVQEETSSHAIESEKALRPTDLRRAVMAWLAKRKPMALADKVPTRLKRFYAGIAAFWSEPGRRKHLLKPQHTVIIEIRADREDCFAESAKSAELLPSIKEAKARKIELEAAIRVNEPHLKDGDFLFSEIESWNYAKSANKEYHQVIKRLKEFDRALNKGGKFERIRGGHVANELYLAVPAGIVRPDELAEGWGLLYVSPTLEVTLVKKADSLECPEENLMHLAQNIGAAAMRDVLFANGIRLASDGTVSLSKPPHRRKASKTI